jgi:hypothetical protein
LPSVPSTLVAVTRPWKRETDASVTFALSHVEPLAVEDRKLATAPDAGWADGPRLAAGVPYATVGRPGTAIAREPAPRQPPGRYDGLSGAYDSVLVVVVPPVVVVVPVPSARAETALNAAAMLQRTRRQTPRRIAPVCRSFIVVADLFQRDSDGSW